MSWSGCAWQRCCGSEQSWHLGMFRSHWTLCFSDYMVANRIERTETTMQLQRSLIKDCKTPLRKKEVPHLRCLARWSALSNAVVRLGTARLANFCISIHPSGFCLGNVNRRTTDKPKNHYSLRLKVPHSKICSALRVLAMVWFEDSSTTSSGLCRDV